MGKLLYVFMAIGIVAIFWGLNKKAGVKAIDNKGRLFSIMNIIDFIVLSFIVWMAPLVIGAYMLFGGSNSLINKSLNEDIIKQRVEKQFEEWKIEEQKKLGIEMKRIEDDKLILDEWKKGFKEGVKWQK